VFRPAYQEMLKRWFALPPFNEDPLRTLFNRLLPAQLYVPTRPAADFAAIADVFNNRARIGHHEIGVVFNAYNLKTGEAVLFGNDQARRQWPQQKSVPRTTASPAASTVPSEDEIKLLEITPEAVQSALWLSLYGFDQMPQPDLMDGAYNRACIVSELHKFDRIFVARPLAQGWLGKHPGNWFEVQDWQTEMWFSAGYKAEVDALSQINGLVAAGYLGPPYKIVELIEIAPETPAGFFHFFIERKSVYKRAYDEALVKFAALNLYAPAAA
jgi:hypothetical protein